MGILRDIFGPSQEEIWQQLAQELSGRFVDGGFWRGDKVQVRVKEWMVTLDTYTKSHHPIPHGNVYTTYTRLRAPYVNKDGFRFTIYRRSVFSNLGKFFGMQDIVIGYPDFDCDFIIKGNDEAQVRALFANPKIRQLIQAQPAIQLCVKDDEGWFGAHFPEGVDELHFVTMGLINDIPRLKALYDLFAEVLNHLCHINSAYENDPRIIL
jgi:hypothetical protein